MASQAVNRFRSKRATTRSNPATADTYDASSHLRQLAPGTTVDSDAAARAVSDAESDQADTPDQAAASDQADTSDQSTLKADIIALLTADKRLSDQQAAKRLGASVGYVRKVASAEGLAR